MGEIADKSRKRPEQMLQTLHPHAGGGVADIGEDGGEALEGTVDGRLLAGLAQPPGEIVARQHHIGDALHHLVEEIDGEADRALDLGGSVLADRALVTIFRFGGGCLFEVGCPSVGCPSTGLQRFDKRIVAAGWKFLASLNLIVHLADPVHDRKDGGDQPTIGVASPGAAVGQGIFRRVAEALEPGEIEEAAIAFDGVDEAENRVEPRLVRRIGFPGDDLLAARLEHFAGFGDEIRQQVIHFVTAPLRMKTAMPEDG